MATFYEQFKENMERLHLDAPPNLFATPGKAVELLTQITAALAANPRAATMTVGELIATRSLTRCLSYVAGVKAAFYTGACIGSLLVATTETLHLPLPLDLVGITRAMQLLRIPIDYGVARAIDAATFYNHSAQLTPCSRIMRAG